MIRSHSFNSSDLQTEWYKRWAKELHQDAKHLEGYALHANKFWQNAVMVQILAERGMVKQGVRGLGFGVGQERLPALFAKYGVHVTATDQDFTTRKAGYWAKQELATGVQSLNKLGICDPKVFNDQTDYMSIDMNNIPGELHGEYDFLWSNCALGHLGSIAKGLAFIEDSLRCLKPGGWAVHTTELNILSDDDTVFTGSTVIFRLKDIYSLQKRLISEGYIVGPFILTLGKQPLDRRVSMAPAFGNDYSKIQVMGHLATQIVLIVHKPEKKPKNTAAQSLAVRSAYLRNKATVAEYSLMDPVIRPILKSQQADVASAIRVRPVKDDVVVKIKKGKSSEIRLEFDNDSEIPLFTTYNRLGESKPIVLATTNPHDRVSDFFHDTWPGENKNRLAVDVWIKGMKGKWELADYVQPKQNFAFQATLHANDLPKGKYHEHFSIVQEFAGWVTNSDVRVTIQII